MKRLYDDFIKSDLDEADFYGVSRENSITLDEYLNEMHNIDRKFHKIANSEIESIKRKLNWVSEADFYDLQNNDKEGHHLSFIYLHTIEGRQICLYKYKKRDFEISFRIPKFAFFDRAFSEDLKRRDDLPKIFEELEEINKIGLGVYNEKLKSKGTVSDNFKVQYRPEAGLYLSDNDCHYLCSYVKNGIKSANKPLVKDKEKGKVYKKILIKK